MYTELNIRWRDERLIGAKKIIKYTEEPGTNRSRLSTPAGARLLLPRNKEYRFCVPWQLNKYHWQDMWVRWIERWQQKKFCAAGERCKSTLEREPASQTPHRKRHRNDVRNGAREICAVQEEGLQTFSCENESWIAKNKFKEGDTYAKKFDTHTTFRV